MRRQDRSSGSIKVLIILSLLFANIVLSLSDRHAEAQPHGSGRRGGPVFGALAENFPKSGAVPTAARTYPGKPPH